MACKWPCDFQCPVKGQLFVKLKTVDMFKKRSSFRNAWQRFARNCMSRRCFGRRDRVLAEGTVRHALA